MEQISLEDINLDIIPIKVLQDVDKRISDWRSMGGKDSDLYIQQQLRYLKRVDGKQRRGYAHIFLNRRNTDEYNRNNSNHSSIDLYRICILHT